MLPRHFILPCLFLCLFFFFPPALSQAIYIWNPTISNESIAENWICPPSSPCPPNVTTPPFPIQTWNDCPSKTEVKGKRKKVLPAPFLIYFFFSDQSSHWGILNVDGEACPNIVIENSFLSIEGQQSPSLESFTFTFIGFQNNVKIPSLLMFSYGVQGGIGVQR